MNNFKISTIDTDGIMISKADDKKFTEEEIKNLTKDLNSNFPEKIRFEFEDLFDTLLVIKAKNYVTFKKSKKGDLFVKGSGLKATMKEKELKRFIDEIIDVLLKDKKDRVFSIYNKYAKKITQITDITDWCTKKTITKAILNPERTNEQKVADIIEDEEYIQEGDKIYTYFKKDKSLGLRDNFDGDYCEETLLDKLYKTLKIFSTVLDIDLIPNYKLARNKDLLEEIKK